jgi:Bacterial regulatory proteins, luxR family
LCGHEGIRYPSYLLRLIPDPKQIAHELGSTERTIKAHRQKVMEKTQAESLAELVGIAARLGILAVPSGASDTPDPGGKKPSV